MFANSNIAAPRERKMFLAADVEMNESGNKKSSFLFQRLTKKMYFKIKVYINFIRFKFNLRVFCKSFKFFFIRKANFATKRTSRNNENKFVLCEGMDKIRAIRQQKRPLREQYKEKMRRKKKKVITLF